MKTQAQPQTIEINEETATKMLIRLFLALQKAFATETDPGVVRAYELIEMLAETAENDGEVFRTILTEDNIKAFTALKKKGDAKGGNIGLSDILKAFPALGGAMKGGMFKGFLS
ncbi:hypothetical protein [Spirosoma litoris]